MKKIIALVLALALVLAVAVASAQSVASGKGGSASITISNAAKGVKYTVKKIFDATYNTTTNTIAYTYNGTLAENDYFAQDANTGEITAKAAAKDSNGDLTQAAANWLKNNITGEVVADDVEDTDGNALIITGLQYGYYLVSSDQGTGSVLSVSSTNPDATMKDKNTTEPDIDKFVATGSTTDGSGNTTTTWGESVDANIGAPVKYKIEAITANWHEPSAGGEQKQVKSYTIGDDLATSKEELVSIDKITVGGADITNEINATAFPITIPWATNTGTNDAPVWTSLYANGAKIVIEYTAKLKDNATIDTLEANENVADLDWTYVDNTPHFGEDEEHLHDEAKTETYGIAFVKVNKNGEKLAGAEFKLPFAATKVDGTDNTWVYAGESAEGTTVTTTSTGAIVVKGLKAGTYSIEETKAPDGYNKLADAVSIQAQKISETTSVTRTDKYWKYDADGNKFDEVESTDSYTTSWSNEDFAVTAIAVLNLEGTLLPSTGGIGTTIFYIVGGLLLVGAAVILVARKRSND